MKRAGRHLCQRLWDNGEKTTTHKEDRIEIIYLLFVPVGNESPTRNNDGMDRVANTTTTDTPVTAFVEVQSLMPSEMSPGLLSPRCSDQPSMNSASLSKNRCRTDDVLPKP